MGVSFSFYLLVYLGLLTHLLNIYSSTLPSQSFAINTAKKFSSLIPKHILQQTSFAAAAVAAVIVVVVAVAAADIAAIAGAAAVSVLNV